MTEKPKKHFLKMFVYENEESKEIKMFSEDQGNIIHYPIVQENRQYFMESGKLEPVLKSFVKKDVIIF